MNQAELRQLIDEAIAGDILPERHQALQQVLKSDPQARAVFRETVDLDASLRTWAAERDGREAEIGAQPGVDKRRPFWGLATALAVTAAIAILAGWFWHRTPDGNSNHLQVAMVEPAGHLGTLVQQKDCVWENPQPAIGSGRFTTGCTSLVSGVAKLQFDSGTNVVMQGPCRLEVLTTDTALLLAGNVVVQVTELSDGFTLKTPDAAILDEGTEYAVSLDEHATEVHVFDGSVFWEPVSGSQDSAMERIEAGEARRFTRSQPGSGARIPLQLRKFVRQIEADVRDNAGDGLLAYDGFENLAGRIRRGRSGFGWSGGWTPDSGTRGSVGTIVDAPDDMVFGIQRTGRRLLQIAKGDALSRDLELPIMFDPGDACYLSFLVQRHAGEAKAGRFLQVTLGNGDGHPRRRFRSEVAFGVTSDGFPYIKAGGIIKQTAPSMEDGAVYLLVGKIVASEPARLETYLRIYRQGETIEDHEPGVWTTLGETSAGESGLERLRIATGSDAQFDVDELRIGTTWRSITAADPAHDAAASITP